MPSEATLPETALTGPVLDVLARPRDAFRSTLVSSGEELRGMLQESTGSDDEWADQLAAELGPFAVGRIDTGALAAVLSEKATLAPAALDVVRRAEKAIDDLAASAPSGVVEVEVPPGGDLRDAVRDALSGVGRVFGAARAAELARNASWRADQHERLFEGIPFRAWTRGERAVAPPLVVRVAGEDLRAGGLGDFLDGSLKIVLRVEGPVSPAPLARLVTPGVMVVQATDAAELAPLADFSGPAVAALFEGAPAATEGAGGVAAFLHDPRRGDFPWQRIALKDDAEALRTLLDGNRWKTRGAREDLEHLLEMVARPAGGAVAEAGEDGEAGGEPVTGADRLAAWLLTKTDLGDA